MTLLPQPLFNTIAAAAAVLLTASLPAPTPDPQSVRVTLDDSAAAEQLASQLSLELTFDDRMGTAAFAQLRLPLVMDGGAVMSEYRAGDLAYLASEQSIIVFLTDGSAVPDDGLVALGHVTSGMDGIAACVRHCLIQLVADPDAG
ncbi:cyclophilin-like fold protein [Micromonospora sp. DT81.3]|uniref:cyclophilin-like fold protein n=1 Tax=Micromonospora sp. DT81.3 TaxID=3416523 RepID=UPI003CEB9C47